MKKLTFHRSVIVLFLFAGLAAGCLAPAVDVPATIVPPAPTLTPTPTSPPAPTHTPTPTPAPVPPTSEPCGYMWATESLPAESEALQSALDGAGIAGVRARAEAFGENCVTASGTVAYFATMQTDFRLDIEVADLADDQALGQVVENVMAVLSSFPPGAFPGPNRGYLGIAFRHGDEVRNLWVRLDDAQRALDNGLRGADLFRTLSAGG